MNPESVILVTVVVNAAIMVANAVRSIWEYILGSGLFPL